LILARADHPDIRTWDQDSTVMVHVSSDGGGVLPGFFQLAWELNLVLI
jgi:hypothetical protein